MALTGADIVDQARDLHPEFHDVLIPEKIALRLLTRAQRALVARAASVNPEPFLKTKKILLPWVDFVNGATFPAHSLVIGGRLEMDNGDLHEVEITSYAQRDGTVFPSVYFVNGTVRPAGTELSWKDANELSLDYVPTSSTVAFDSTLDAPDEAEDVLVALVSYFMARRASGAGVDVNVSQFEDEADDAMSFFIESLATRKSAHTDHIRDTWF